MAHAAGRVPNRDATLPGTACPSASLQEREVEKVYDVPAELKMADQWLMPYLASLNPETEYERMISIFAQYSLNMFALQFVVTAGTLHNIQTPDGAETLAYTNKIVRRPNRRNADGLGFFWTWFACGPSHPRSQESLRRLNDIHMGVAKHLPGNFSRNEDFVYTLCVIGTLQDRVMASLGLPTLPPFLQVAMHHVLRDLAGQFVTETAPVRDFPGSYEGMVRFVEEYDARDWGATSKAHTTIAESMIHDFANRFFPPHLHWLGENYIKFAVKEHLLLRYGVQPLSPEELALTAQVMKTMYLQQMMSPDNKVSFLDTWQPPSNEEIIAADRRYAALADARGWLKGGEETLAATRR